MSKLKIAAFVGSLQQNSLNKKLLKNLIELAPENIEITTVEIGNLPLFNQDLEVDLPTPVREVKSQITAADAILFVTPEYNRSVPGVLKNAIDWGSRPWGQNSWSGKPAAIAGATMGPIGTFGAQQHLRQIAPQLHLAFLPEPQIYFGSAHLKMDEAGNITDDAAREELVKFWESFVIWINRFQD